MPAGVSPGRGRLSRKAGGKAGRGDRGRKARSRPSLGERSPKDLSPGSRRAGPSGVCPPRERRRAGGWERRAQVRKTTSPAAGRGNPVEGAQPRD